MRKYYDYDPRLNFIPSFNIWQHNFEGWPINMLVNKAIENIKKNVKDYIPMEEVSLSKDYYKSDDGLLPYYKISPKGKENQTLPVIIYYHGGGFICPLDVMMLNNGSFYAKELNCHVLLPEYRLAPDFSAKDMLTDCYNMLLYAEHNREMLCIDMSKLIILGDSAGAALAAGVVLMSRDYGGPKPAGQVLIYPVTDCQINRYPSMELKYAEWNKNANIHMWNMAFNKGKLMLPYIAPIQNSSHINLPKTYIEVAEYDTLKDQGLYYAEKLMAASVPVTINEIKGTYHGFDNQINNPFVKEILEKRCDEIRKCVN